MASHFPGQLIVSNEVIQSRASILTENMTRWGSPNVVVTQNDARFQSAWSFFDLIMVDAPAAVASYSEKIRPPLGNGRLLMSRSVHNVSNES
jgi:hypothetical protein